MQSIYARTSRKDGARLNDEQSVVFVCVENTTRIRNTFTIDFNFMQIFMKFCLNSFVEEEKREG